MEWWHRCYFYCLARALLLSQDSILARIRKVYTRSVWLILSQSIAASTNSGAGGESTEFP
jgi:hypothetical protein